MASDIAWTVIPVVVAAAVVGLPLLAVAVVVARLRGRRVSWLVPALVTLLGLILGYLLLVSESAPILRVAGILGCAVVTGVLLLTGRLTTAGLGLIAAALPWTAYAGAYLVDGASSGGRLASSVAVPPFIAGVIGIVVGSCLIRFHRQDLARRPAVADPVAPGPAGPRVWNAASQVILGPSIFGLTIPAAASAVVLVVGAQATAVAAHGRPILETIAIVVAGSIASGLGAVLAWALVWPPLPRRAFEAFAWLGEAEFARFRALTAGRVAPTLDNMKRYVRNTTERPDDRWLRADILAATGKLNAAREVAERIPDETPIGRMERANYLAYIDWLAGGGGDLADFRAGIATIEPAGGDERLLAEVALALAEVRLLVSAGDADPARPMREVRDRIGARANGVLFAAARRLVPGYLKVAFALVIVVSLLDRAFTV